MEILPVALAIVAITTALYYFIFKRRNVFKDHGIPYIPTQPIVGNMGPLVFRKLSFPDLIHQMYYSHPEAAYIGIYEFGTPIIVVRDVNLIKSIAMKNFDSFPNHRPFTDKDLDPLLGSMLFFQNDSDWKQNRSIVSPTFTSSKIKSMFPLMQLCAMNFADYLTKLPINEREIELKILMTKYTNDVITSCAFGVNVDSKKDPNNPFYVHGRKATNVASPKMSFKFMLYRNAPRISRALNLSFIEKDSADFFHDVISSTVKERDEQGISRPDMIQLLMETRNRAGKVLTTYDIAVHSFTFFFGGFDTVASQLSYILHHLSTYPEVQERLQREVDDVLEATQGQVTYDAIMGMEYLDAVINESMRLMPVAVFLDRMCTKAFELPPAVPGGKQFEVKPGMNLWFPAYAIHHDPNHYEDPEKFDPERFFNDGKSIINSGKFMPFGIGPRICIGNRFALTKMKVLLFYMLTRCDIECSPKTILPLELAKGTINLAAKNGFWAKIVPRKDSHPLAYSVLKNATEN